MDKDWLFLDDEYSCGLRVAGVLVNDGMILVQKDLNGEEYALPGGHVKIGETLENALIREIEEEIRAKIKCTRMLWSEESFWEWGGKQAHDISFYYLAELLDEPDIPKNGGFVPQKDNQNVVLRWMSIDNIPKVTIYPEFLKDEICRLDGPVKHFISKDQ